MIKAIIRWSVQNPLLVLLSTLALALFGYQASQQIKLDALPDLSDVQVIIKASYPGQTPETIEQQLSYPLSSALLAVPKAKAVRSFLCQTIAISMLFLKMAPTHTGQDLGC